MEHSPTVEKAIGQSLYDLLHIDPIISVLIFIVMGLCWFIRSLLQDARNERQLNRDALNGSTAVISELKGMIYAIVNKH